MTAQMMTNEQDLFGDNIQNTWGGKRRNAGRMSLTEKARLRELDNNLLVFKEQEQKYFNTPKKKLGSHRISCEMIKQIAHLIPQKK